MSVLICAGEYVWGSVDWCKFPGFSWHVDACGCVWLWVRVGESEFLKRAVIESIYCNNGSPSSMRGTVAGGLMRE